MKEKFLNHEYDNVFIKISKSLYTLKTLKQDAMYHLVILKQTT